MSVYTCVYERMFTQKQKLNLLHTIHTYLKVQSQICNTEYNRVSVHALYKGIVVKWVEEKQITEFNYYELYLSIQFNFFIQVIGMINTIVYAIGCYFLYNEWTGSKGSQ